MKAVIMIGDYLQLVNSEHLSGNVQQRKQMVVPMMIGILDNTANLVIVIVYGHLLLLITVLILH